MSISFNQVPSEIRVPLFYAEMDNSAAHTVQESRRALLLGHALSKAPMERNTPCVISSGQVAQALAGGGSQLHRMVTAYRRVDPLGELWVMAVPEHPHGDAVSAFLFLAGQPQSAGVLKLSIGCEKMQIAVAQTNTLLEIATALSQAINTHPALPVRANVEQQEDKLRVHLTARHNSYTRDDIPLALNAQSPVGENGLPSGLNVSVYQMTAGGYAPDLKDTIASMGDTPFDFIGLPFNDSDTLRLFQQEMNDTSGRWSPFRQLYGHVYTAKRGTFSELVEFGDTLNDPHLTVAGYESNIQTPLDELVAARVARSAVFLRADPARPTQTGVLNGVLPAPVGKRFTLTEQQTLLSHGIATSYVEGDQLRIGRDITTYKKNAYGGADNSYLDSETLHTSA